MKTKRCIRNIDISIDLARVALGVLGLAAAVGVLGLIALLVLAIPTLLESDYNAFERNYNDCMQAEVFTESRCQDIAYGIGE